jgi:hypothetical protein
MKTTIKLLGITVLLTVILLGMAACGDDGGGPDAPPKEPEIAFYNGIAADGSLYTLKIIENTGRYAAQDGDSYILYVTANGVTKKSEGTVTMAGFELTLKPATNVTAAFTIRISETGITSITGTITFTDNSPPQPAPETVTPVSDTLENRPDAERWGTWNDINSTATTTISVAQDGLCTVTVSGTAMPPLDDGNPETDDYPKWWNSIWRTNASYGYTIIAGKTYTYEFEAWTAGGDRALNFQWYFDINTNNQSSGYEPEDGSWDNLETKTCPPKFIITPVRTTYTFTSNGPLPVSGKTSLDFQCANQTGTFYVKILSITHD